jgi:hypothetical protein
MDVLWRVCARFLSGDWATWYAWVLAASYSVGINLLRVVVSFYRAFRRVLLAWCTAIAALVFVSSVLEFCADRLREDVGFREGWLLKILVLLQSSANGLLVLISLPVSVPIVSGHLTWKHKLAIVRWFGDWILIFARILGWFWDIMMLSLGKTILPDVYNGAVWVCMELLLPLIKLPGQIFAIGTIAFTAIWTGFFGLLASLGALVWLPLSWLARILGSGYMTLKSLPGFVGELLSRALGLTPS